MMHEAGLSSRPPFMQGLLQSIENEARMRRPAHPPADDAPRVGVNAGVKMHRLAGVKMHHG